MQGSGPIEQAEVVQGADAREAAAHSPGEYGVRRCVPSGVPAFAHPDDAAIVARNSKVLGVVAPVQQLGEFCDSSQGADVAFELRLHCTMVCARPRVGGGTRNFRRLMLNPSVVQERRRRLPYPAEAGRRRRCAGDTRVPSFSCRTEGAGRSRPSLRLGPGRRLRRARATTTATATARRDRSR